MIEFALPRSAEILDGDIAAESTTPSSTPRTTTSGWGRASRAL